MKLLILALLASGVQAENEANTLETLRERAETIIEESQALEIDMVTARRRVQLLLRDLKTWAEEHEVELEARTKTYTTPAKQTGEPLTADRCPLFFEEELEDLCPLDLARSEVWGGEVVFCRYLCTTE